MNKGFIPEDIRRDHIVVALVGQPNVGKSTIYNQLTGAFQHIGNWPGKTVEVAWTRLEFNGEKIVMVDLPGTYTLSGFTEEEEVAVDFILNEKPDAIIVITDVSALPRNLYLLLQVLEMTSKVVLVVNMMDEAERWGIRIDLNKIRSIFGIPTIGTVAIKGIGLNDMLRLAIRVAKNPPSPRKIRYGVLEEYICEIENYVRELEAPSKARYIAIKIIEGDTKLLERYPEDIKIKIVGVLEKIKFVFKRDPRLIIASERYKIIDEILLETFSRKRLVDRLTEKFDQVFFKRGIDLVLSFVILFATFFIAYQIGYYFTDLLDYVLSEIILARISNFISPRVPQWGHSLIIDGVLGGMIFAITFIPLVFIFTFTLSFIENLGVLARISLALDRFFARFDASGKSFFPMVMGLACNVISVASSRVVASKKEKLRVMIASQFIQCPPRQVVIALILGLLFSPLIASLLFGLYVIFGFLLALIVFRVLRIFEGPAREELPIELPPYRIPSLKVISKISWNRTIVFIKRAGGLIVLANVVLWILSNIPPGVSIEQSIIGVIGKVVSIIFAPIGLEWRETIALITGLVAKEITLGTLEFLYGDMGILISTNSIASILAFLTIYAYYMPCFATMAAIKSESGSWRYTAKAIIISISVAILLGYIVFAITKMLT